VLTKLKPKTMIKHYLTSKEIAYSSLKLFLLLFTMSFSIQSFATTTYCGQISGIELTNGNNILTISNNGSYDINYLPI